MRATTFESLIHKYTEKANFHGREAILDHPSREKYHLKMEKYFDQLLIAVGEKYLSDYARNTKKTK